MTTKRTIKSADGDRRRSEFWLQDVVEMALYHRFCMKGADPRALILHGKVHGSATDFVLLDADCKLTLVEVKYGQITPAKAKEAHKQLAGYISTYRAMTIEALATSYCHHGVDVYVWYEHRKQDPVQPEDTYGKLLHYSKNAVEYYLEGTKNPERALEILREDYARIVGGTLDRFSGSETLNVRRCIMLAEADWGTGFKPEPVDGVPFERWSYAAPKTWIQPDPAHA